MFRRTTILILCALALPSSRRPPRSPTAKGATIDKTGWWNRANTTTPTPAGPVTIPPPPGIPESDLSVGAIGSESSAILAVGIKPDDGPGRHGHERPAAAHRGLRRPGPTRARPARRSIACPIIDFWAGGGNGDWETRPTVDCAAASLRGVRADDGVWEFDLTPIAKVWFDPFATIVADGVVVQPDLDKTSPFQAVFKGGDDIDVVLESTPSADDGEDPFATPPFEDPPADAGFSSGGSPGGGGSIFSPPVVASPPATFVRPGHLRPTPVAPTTPPATRPQHRRSPSRPPPSRSPAGPATSSATSRRSSCSACCSSPALLVATSYWFGPAGQPVTTIRQRGVSRALAARSPHHEGNPEMRRRASLIAHALHVRAHRRRLRPEGRCRQRGRRWLRAGGVRRLRRRDGGGGFDDLGRRRRPAATLGGGLIDGGSGTVDAGGAVDRRHHRRRQRGGDTGGTAGGGGGRRRSTVVAAEAARPRRQAAAGPAPAGDRTGITDTEIVIGIHAPVTGAAPIPQTSFDVGKDVYWKMINDQGGLFGRKVRIVFEDDQFDPRTAVAKCKKMVTEDKVFMLVGGGGADQITACAQYANSVGVPYLSAGVNEAGLARRPGLLRPLRELRPAVAPARPDDQEDVRRQEVRHRRGRLGLVQRRLRQHQQGGQGRPG